MDRIQVDFAMQRGHEMILRRDPPFVRAELDEVDLRMLQSERPDGLLALDWFEMDGCVTFRYAIDGRKMLPHRMMTGSFGMNDFVGLMLGIVEALDNCGHYLLRESCCLLEEKFLYIGEDWRDVALTYVPLRDSSVRKPVREELLALAVRLIGKADRVDGDIVQTVLRLLEDPAASWTKVRVGLLQRLATEERHGAVSPETGSARANRNTLVTGHPEAGGRQAYGTFHADAGPDLPDSGSGQVWEAGHADGRTGESAERHHAADGETPDGGRKGRFEQFGRMMRRDEPADVPPPETMMFDDRDWSGTTGRIRDTGRARWMSVTGAILATALIWRYIYLPSPGTDRLLISLGATLLTAGGLFLLWQRLGAGKNGFLDGLPSTGGTGSGPSDIRGDGRRLSEPADGGQVDGGNRNDAAEIRFPWLTDFARNDLPLPDAYGPDGDGEAQHVPGMRNVSDATGVAEMPGTSGKSGMAQTAGLHTGDMGRSADETVLLARDGGENRVGRFWLVREYEGQHHRYPVEPGISVIGRSEASARIVDTAEGVSRAHVEIEFDGAEVRIKDLASRNGTLLGGEIMVPYKEYALCDGIAFRLAGPDGPKYTLLKGS